MVWISSVESEGSRSLSETGCDLLPTAKSTPFVKESSSVEWPPPPCVWPLSGMTLPLLEGINSTVQSISFTEAFRARILASLETDRAWRESAVAYSKRSLGCVSTLSRNSSFWKMYLPLLPEEELTWLGELPKWGMTVDGALFPLRPLELFIFVNDGSYWPTLTASDAKRGTSPPSQRKRDNPGLLCEINIRLKTHNKKVNLAWLEWFMMYPIGHTELAPWAMQWYQNKRAKRSKP